MLYAGLSDPISHHLPITPKAAYRGFDVFVQNSSAFPFDPNDPKVSVSPRMGTLIGVERRFYVHTTLQQLHGHEHYEREALAPALSHRPVGQPVTLPSCQRHWLLVVGLFAGLP